MLFIITLFEGIDTILPRGRPCVSSKLLTLVASDLDENRMNSLAILGSAKHNILEAWGKIRIPARRHAQNLDDDVRSKIAIRKS